MERSSFFNAVLNQEGNPDRIYLAEDFARYFATFIGNGIFPNPANQLQVVSNNDMTITLKPGKAWINGYFYENTDDYILKLDVADGVLNRVDRVVLKLDFLERKIKAVVKKGKWGSNAKAKDLQRDTDAYEIALANVKVNKGAISITQADITDTRLNKELCGIVHGTVEQVDTTTIFNQFQSWYSKTKDNYNDDIAKWTKEKKQAFEEWYTKNTQAFMKQFNNWYSSNTTQWEDNFKDWFENVKDILSKDAAGNLLKEINNLQTNKVDKINGKGLSTNDYTDTEKQKLEGIEARANKYTHPSTHPATMIKTIDGKNVEEKFTKAKQDLNRHEIKKIHQGELHGLKLNKNKELEYYDGNTWKHAGWRDIDDFTNSPGPKKLVGGNMQAGYFGVVPMSSLITGNELASKIGLSAGTSQFSSTAGWLKFAYKGKIQFVAKKPLRCNSSWDDINTANAVYGDKTIVIGGLTTYKVRLMRGANKDPAGAYNGSVCHYSEWNKLMLPIHIRAKDKNWKHSDNVESDVPYWGVDFTDEDLLTHYNHGNGSYSWCQEEAESSASRVYRGRYGVSSSYSRSASYSSSDYGWRPVLELVF